jgi:mannose-6-phosphate isomerase-like protein (cupin superfamily)
MALFIDKPAIVTAAGNKPKQIEEYFGRASTKTQAVSIARMKSPEGWEEPSQKPAFDEYTVVVRGTLKVNAGSKEFILKEGQAILIEKGERVKYSTPYKEGAEYIAVCIPAFSVELVNREVQ